MMSSQIQIINKDTEITKKEPNENSVIKKYNN